MVYFKVFARLSASAFYWYSGWHIGAKTAPYSSCFLENHNLSSQLLCFGTGHECSNIRHQTNELALSNCPGNEAHLNHALCKQARTWVILDYWLIPWHQHSYESLPLFNLSRSHRHCLILLAPALPSEWWMQRFWQVFGHSTDDLKQAQGPSINQLHASSHLALIAVPTSQKLPTQMKWRYKKSLEPKVHTKGIFRHIFSNLIVICFGDGGYHEDKKCLQFLCHLAHSIVFLISPSVTDQST